MNKGFTIENGVLISYSGTDREIAVPEYVTEIGRGAFHDQVTLTAVRLPQGLRVIGEFAFSGCTGLREIQLPEGVEEIGNCAFAICHQLTSLPLPKSLKKMGSAVFQDCVNLTELPVAKGNSAFRWENGLLLRRREVLCCPRRQTGSVSVPDGVTKIASLAFANCGGVTEILLPDSVTAIGGSAFAQCKALRRLRLPQGIQKIGSGMASGCAALTEIKLPESLTDIGENTFYQTGLTSITIPAGVTIVRRRAFAGCQALREVTILGDAELTYETFAHSGVEILRLCAGKVVPSTFDGCDRLTTVIAEGASFASLPKGPVKNGAILTLVRRISDSEEDFPDQEEGLRYLRAHRRSLFPLAIAHPELLRLLFIQGMLTKKDFPPLLAEAEKQDNSAAKAAVLEYQDRAGGPVDPFEELEREMAKADRIVAYIEKNGTLPVSELKKIWSYRKERDGTLTITSYKGTDTDITVPDVIGKSPVTGIEGAFGTTSLGLSEERIKVRRSIRHVTLPQGLKRIGDGSFYSCASLVDLKIPENVSTIGISAFARCVKLKHLTLPETVKEIDEGAFIGCTGLISFTLPSKIRKIPRYAFRECRGLKEITFPDHLEEIGFLAFCACTSLNRIDLPSSLQVLDMGAFQECTALREVILPPGLTEIGPTAFSNCTALRQITIPKGVARIHNSAFYKCRSLQDIRIPRSVSFIGQKAFDLCPDLTIHAPARSAAAQYAREHFVKFLPTED